MHQKETFVGQPLSCRQPVPFVGPDIFWILIAFAVQTIALGQAAALCLQKLVLCLFPALCGCGKLMSTAREYIVRSSFSLGALVKTDQ
mmetsp:Transcript_41375/g.125247  ORF Transcript_41375/g.125247 Transcript_41375/m.125247 type:complete len:88 (-) Transcript_41375:2015-2278(-)